MRDKTIVVLTGAGISAESGIPTFRASDGLWCNHRIADVATPGGFYRNPKLVHEFYNARRAQLRDVKPNLAHIALAELASQWQGRLLIITQNVDDLHERAEDGFAFSKGYSLLHMHGELTKIRCTACEAIVSWHNDLFEKTACSLCHKTGCLRPHIVWFEEIPMHMDTIEASLDACDLFMAIGTSGHVYPAANFVHQARSSIKKAYTVELNYEPSLVQSMFHEKIYGPATKLVPDYVQKILQGDCPAFRK